MLISRKQLNLQSKIKHCQTHFTMKVIIYFWWIFFFNWGESLFFSYMSSPVNMQDRPRKVYNTFQFTMSTTMSDNKISRKSIDYFFHFSSGGNINSSPKPAPFQKNRVNCLCCLPKLRSYTTFWHSWPFPRQWPMKLRHARFFNYVFITDHAVHHLWHILRKNI